MNTNIQNINIQNINIQNINLNNLKLNSNGCQFIKNAYDKDSINNLKNKISDFIVKNKILHHVHQNKDLLGKDFYLNCGNKKVNSYHEMKYGKRCTINVRGDEHGRTDTNLLDFFNPQYLFGLEISHIVNIDNICKLLNKLSGKQWYLDRTNIYVNIEIKNTRGFHTDTKYPYIKVFLPLTDIKDINDGPYCYMQYSQQSNPKIKPSPVIFCPANQGDMIISYQNGLHRGCPQKEGRIRKMLVFGFKQKV